MATFTIVGINPPGRMNVRLGGSFREVNLFELSQEQLAALHVDGNPYIRTIPGSDKKQPIHVKEPTQITIKKPKR